MEQRSKMSQEQDCSYRTPIISLELL